jgi:S-adenosylmethionine:tRNA ribosyltransferase-isomerase
LALKTSDFDFDLPPDRIALRPAQPRDSARLLLLNDAMDDRNISDLPDLLRAGDLLVVNNTRVLPARLSGQRGDVQFEATLLRPVQENAWASLAKPAKRLRLGDEVVFVGNFKATVLDKKENGEVVFEFVEGTEQVIARLEEIGQMPLPPYIANARATDKSDLDDYQTLFAEVPGAVAAPTAGLHFTPSLIEKLKARGVDLVELTLHVGAGTFLPVRSEMIKDHQMHSEWGEINAAAAQRINATREVGGRIIAVGSTAMRLMESAASPDGIVQAYRGETDIFITPGYQFRVCDMMLTNFHLPRSTLFILVCAFAGAERMKSAYVQAIEAGYRFYSYGDACLLERHGQ